MLKKSEKRMRITVNADCPDDLVTAGGGIDMEKVKHYVEQTLQKEGFTRPFVREITEIKRYG